MFSLKGIKWIFPSSLLVPPHGRLTVCAGDGTVGLGQDLLLSEQEMHSQGIK